MNNNIKDVIEELFKCNLHYGNQQLQQYSDISFEIFTIDGLYKDEEISLLKNYVENSDINNRTFTHSEFKNGKIIKEDLSNLMFSRIQEFLPYKYTDRNNINWKFEGTSKYIMYAKIKINELFGLHTDTGAEYDTVNNKYSKYTVLTYLNDDFKGGETKFFNNDFKETCIIKPKYNRTLIFDINLYHMGNPIIFGNKYWIGTELVCNII